MHDKDKNTKKLEQENRQLQDKTDKAKQKSKKELKDLSEKFMKLIQQLEEQQKFTLKKVNELQKNPVRVDDNIDLGNKKVS